MAEVQPSLDEGLGVGHRWEEVFLATDAALDSTERTEDGTTATALLVWKDKLDNLCLQAMKLSPFTILSCPEPGKCTFSYLFKDLLLAI